MTHQIFNLPPQQPLSAAGRILPGNKLYFYLTDSSTPADVYTTYELDVAHTQPVEADAGGRHDTVYLDPEVTYKLTVTDANDVLLYTIDPCNDQLLSAESVGRAIYPQTAAETSAGVTITDYSKFYGNLLRYDVNADGSTDDAAEVSRAIDTGYHIEVPRGYTFAISGNVTNFTDRQRIFGGGCFKKIDAEVRPMMLLPDEVSDVWFDDIEFDGNRTLFSNGNAVPAIFGYLVNGLRVTNCYFHDIIDGAIKLRDGAGLTCIGNRFYRCVENGIELRNYDEDPRTSDPYVGTRPTIEGNHRVIGNHFEFVGRIEDGGSGIVDGCGITFDSVSSSYPLKDIVVAGNTFVDCLRFVWTENNTLNSEAQNISITGNTMRGNVHGTGAGAYGKYGIGLIGVKGATVTGNTLINISNYDAPGSDRASIVLSATVGTTDNYDIVIDGNTCIDDTGSGTRTEYGIDIVAGTRIRVVNNHVRGHSTAQVRVSSSNVTDLICHSNTGAELDYSWGPTGEEHFVLENPGATATLNMQLPGSTNQEYIAVTARKLVGLSLRASAAVAAGTVSFTPKKNGVAFNALQITQADIASQRAVKTVSAADGLLFAASDVLTVEVATDGSYAPTTNDFSVTAVFDTGFKK